MGHGRQRCAPIRNRTCIERGRQTQIIRELLRHCLADVFERLGFMRAARADDGGPDKPVGRAPRAMTLVADEKAPLVMSLMSFWGAGGVIRAGALVRTDHPIVLHVPEWFVPANSSHAEVTEASRRIWECVTEA